MELRRLAFIAVLMVLLFGLSISTLQAHPITKTEPIIPPIQWFEPNQGQSDPQFTFIAHDRGYMLFLAGTEIVYSLVQPSTKEQFDLEQPLTFVNVHLELVGANANPTMAGYDPLPGFSNYFTGNQTFTNIPHYAGVRYSNLYSGIDMVYYSNQGQLHYDFEVAPGADPAQIRLRFSEIEQLEIASNGDLRIHAANNAVLTHKAPIGYQTANSVRQERRTHYVLVDANTVGFEIEQYDVSRPLVIDPPVVYSTYIGGAVGGDTSVSVAADAAGNAYIAGQAQAPGFPTTPGALDGTYEGYADIFITKVSPDGSTLIYSTYLGGNNGEYPSSMAVDNVGNAYVTGGTQSGDFPLTGNAFQTAATTLVYVSKLNAAGNALLYSTRFGGTGGEESNDIAVDNAGNAYIAGATQSLDFPLRNAAQAYGGGGDAFVARLNTNAAGNASLVYSTYFGGNGGVLIPNDIARSISVDVAGNAYITGETYSANFPTTANAYDNTLGGARDTFVVRLNTNAAGPASVIYSTLLGGTTGSFGPVFTGADISYGIAADNAGNAYITGHTYAPNFPTTVGAFDTTFGGVYDAYVTKVNTNAAGAASLIYSTFLGGGNSDEGMGIALSSTGVYVVGYTTSADFPTVDPSQPQVLGVDAFVTGLNADGSALTYSTSFGGSFAEHGLGVAVDAADNIYFTGFTQSSDFPTTNGVFDTTLGSWMDGFVVKMGAVTPTPTPTSTPTAIYTPTSTATLAAPPSPTLATMPTNVAQVATMVPSQSSVGALDMSISKIGFLQPGQTQGQDQIEWIIIVQNTGSIVGKNITVSDTLRNDLRIDRVEVSKGSFTISGQTVTATIASLMPGEQVLIHIFTFSTPGTVVDNTACASADNFSGSVCSNSRVVRTLPQTGNEPWWRTPLLAVIGAGLLFWGLRRVARRSRFLFRL